MTSTPRQRKQASKKNPQQQQQQQQQQQPDADEGDEQAEPMDETEQQQVVDQLREDALEQMELVHGIFSTVCRGAMMLSLLLGVTTGDVQGWMHVILAVVLHWGAIRMAATAKPGTNTSSYDNGFTTYGVPILVLLTVMRVVLSMNNSTNNSSSIKVGRKNQHDDHVHHLGLALSNVVTMLGAMYLKHDSQSTKKALEELEKSKYRYKSL